MIKGASCAMKCTFNCRSAGPMTVRLSMQMPVARMRLQCRSCDRLLLGGRAAFPFLVEHLVDHIGHLVDSRFVEMRRQKCREIFFDTLAADFMYRFGARANEDLLEFFFAVVVIARHSHLRSVLGQWPQRLECFGDACKKAAADFAGPAHIERLFLRIEAHARLFALEALNLVDGVDFEVVQPWPQRV